MASDLVGRIQAVVFAFPSGDERRTAVLALAEEVAALESRVEHREHQLRRVRAEPYVRTPAAWSDEDGNLCVLGTHDLAAAAAAVTTFMGDVDSGDEEWDAWARSRAALASAHRAFVDPLVVEEEVWPMASISTVPVPGWLPYLFARYP